MKQIWLAVLLFVVMGMSEAGCGKKTPPGTLRWVALGDSLTVGYGVSPEQSYPNRVQAMSAEERFPVDCVKNLAGGGHTLAKVQLLQLPQVVFHRPDIVSIWVGTNDALLHDVTGIQKDHLSGEPLPTPLENFESRLDAVLKKLAAMNLRGVYLAKLHDLSRLPVARGWPTERVESLRKRVVAYNQIMERSASKHRGVYLVPLDQIAALTEPGQYFEDGIHPRPEVYKKVAKVFWATFCETVR